MIAGFALVAAVFCFFARVALTAAKSEQFASDQADADAINRRLSLQKKTEGSVLCLRTNAVRIP